MAKFIAIGNNNNIGIYMQSLDGIDWEKVEFFNADRLSSLIQQSPNSGTVNDPKILNLSLFLTLEIFGQILSIINQSGKYVNLNLTDCITETNDWFNTNNISTGKNRIIELSFPNTVTKIPNNIQHNGYTNLTKVILNNITNIGDGVFRNTANLNSIDLSKVTDIGGYAFFDYTKLTSVNLSKLVNLGGGAFTGNRQDLRFVVENNPNFSTIQNNRILIKNGDTVVSVPSLSGAITIPNVIYVASHAISPWVSQLILPDVETLWTISCYHALSMNSLEIPKIINILSNSFSNCFNLTSIKMGRTAPIIGTNALSNDEGIRDPKTITIRIPNGATGYGTATARTDVTTKNWANGLRGAGWNGTTCLDMSKIKDYLTIQFQYY